MTTNGAWLIVIGCGNVGSHLGPLLARLAGVARITLYDADVYSRHNLASQAIRLGDVGKAKAAVQARRLRRIDPRLSVRGVASAIEDVPLGWLRGDVLLAAVDSRAARRTIGGIAWHLGIPMIDAGVNADGLLARVNVYRPGAGAPCLECAWDDDDYAALETAYPCGADGAPAPTGAPASLGALAASLQAIECQKVLAERWAHALVGRQVTVAAEASRVHVTTYRRNPRCRFDHATWTISDLEAGPDRLTLAAAFAMGEEVRVAGQAFARRLTCPSCGATRRTPLRLVRRLPRAERSCPCGGAMRPTGFDSTEWLRPDGVSIEEREMPVARLGLAAGDVLSVRAPERITHHQIGGRR